MACCNVIHVKRWVLTHQDDIGFLCQINDLGIAQVIMIARLIAQGHRSNFGKNPAPVVKHVVGMIMQKIISARLGFQPHDKG